MFFATGDVMESEPSTSSSIQRSPSQACHQFKFSEIMLATKNFDQSLVIGSGCFGKVYKGNVIHGSSPVVAAIKRLDSMSTQGPTEFWAEIEMLSMLRHCNLVSLLGYCNHEKEMILLYEYMPNGTLDDHLHKLRSPLSWVQESIKEGNLKHIIDSDIKGEISPKCLKEFIKITERCLHISPKQRPTMAEVLFSLESILALQVKFSNSLQSARRTIFGRMVNLIPFSANNEENYVERDSKLSSNNKSNNTFQEMKEVPTDFKSPSPRLNVFKFADLEKATRKFSQDLLLGEGGFGKVFFGWFEQNTFAPSIEGVGIAIAVKRLNKESVQGYEEWLAEVNILGHMAHPNIIRLLGYCRDEHEHLLVYEYMPNKSLDHFLFKGHDIKCLSWETRLLIMIGVARGLTYLHSAKLMCRGLISGDILLDENFNAKIGDFGLVKYGPETEETHVSTSVMGRCGYVAPEYIATGHLSTKADIYSFGVVLLEIISGRRVLDFVKPQEQRDLVEWAAQINSKRRNLNIIMDPRLERNYPKEGASECFALALRCVADKPKDRPSSEEVLQSLEHISALNK